MNATLILLLFLVAIQYYGKLVKRPNIVLITKNIMIHIITNYIHMSNITRN